MQRTLFVAALVSLFSSATAARADIFQWEYINPADPSQGKRQSTTLALWECCYFSLRDARLRRKHI